MREFFILLKYGGSTVYSQPLISKKKKYNLLKNQLILSLIGSVPLGIIIFFFTKDLFTNLYSVDPRISKLMFLFWMTILSLFFIIGYLGMAMYSLSRNEEIELLLTMPIKRRTLTIYQIFVSTISQMFVLSFYFFIYLSYMIVTKDNIILGITRLLVHFMFLLSFSSVIAVLLGGRTSKGFVRKLNVFISLFAIFFYLFIISFQNVKIDQFQAIAKLFNFITKPYNIFAWSFISNNLFFLASVITILLVLIFSKLADNLAFEPIERKTSKNYRIKGPGNIIKAIYSKDLKATLRYEQFLYFILYPIGFGIFFSFINKDYFITLFTIIPITTFYVAFETAILTNSELLNIKTILSYPIKFSTLMFPKVIIPTSINFVIVFGIFIISAFKENLTLLSYMIIPITFLLFSMSSIIGIYFVIKNPPKTENMNRIFGIGQTFIIEGITMGLAFGSILPIVFLNNPQTSFKSKIIFLLIMFASICTSIIISITIFRKLKKHLDIWIEN